MPPFGTLSPEAKKAVLGRDIFTLARTVFREFWIHERNGDFTPAIRREVQSRCLGLAPTWRQTHAASVTSLARSCSLIPLRACRPRHRADPIVRRCAGEPLASTSESRMAAEGIDQGAGEDKQKERSHEGYGSTDYGCCARIQQRSRSQGAEGRLRLRPLYRASRRTADRHSRGWHHATRCHGHRRDNREDRRASRDASGAPRRNRELPNCPWWRSRGVGVRYCHC